MTLDQLIQPVKPYFDLFQMEYQRHTRSDVPLLSEVEEYLGQFPGKQLRPLLVLLSAKACDTMQNGTFYRNLFFLRVSFRLFCREDVSAC